MAVANWSVECVIADVMLRAVIIAALAVASAPLAWNQEDPPNVNSRYTVESVRVEGYRSAKVGQQLKSDIDAVVGQKLDQSLLERLRDRIRKDLRVDKVSLKVARGTQPEHVSVAFLVEDTRKAKVDVSVPQFSYHSRLGWTGKGEVRLDAAGNRFEAAMLSDGDTKVERFSGVELGYSRAIGSRVRAGFDFGAYHDQWNMATIEAAADSPVPAGLYRSRQTFNPSVTIAVAEPLTLRFGVSVQSMEEQYPAAATTAANTVNASLRFRHGFWTGDAGRSNVDAGYSLRAATHTLGSDYVYVRNAVDARYELSAGKQMFIATFLAGGISGDAPLFERFVLGNATTLRGWNKFDLDPLGGDRVAYGSLEYRWKIVQVFYDTGAVWDKKSSSGAKQSVGFGVRSGLRDGILVAVAFPIQGGRMDPMFIVGFNF